MQYYNNQPCKLIIHEYLFLIYIQFIGASNHSIYLAHCQFSMHRTHIPLHANGISVLYSFSNVEKRLKRILSPAHVRSVFGLWSNKTVVRQRLVPLCRSKRRRRRRRRRKVKKKRQAGVLLCTYKSVFSFLYILLF